MHTKTTALVLLSCATAWAQFSSAPRPGVRITQTNPAGTTCAANTATGKLYRGALYTCQSGTYAALAGGAGISPGSSTYLSGLTLAALASPSSAPTATLGSPGNLSVGAYSYTVTFSSSTGETTQSPSSTPVSVSTPATAGQMTLSIPLGPAGTTARNIYRTKAGGSVFFWLATVSDNTTATYTDNVADASLSTLQPPSVNTTGSTTGPTVQDVRASASETNLRPLRVHFNSANLGTTGGYVSLGARNGALSANANLVLGQAYNIALWSETLSGKYGATNSTIDTTKTLVWNGVTLGHVTSANFFGNINIAAPARPTFTTGQQYLFSYFIRSNEPREQFVWHGNGLTSSAEAWGASLIDNNVRRIWFTCTGISTTAIDCGSSTPATALGSGPATQQLMIQFGTSTTKTDVANGYPQANDVFMGGFQIEPIATEKQGIAALGDSKTQYDCGTWGLSGCSSWTRYAEGLMNVPIFNRGISGQTCTQMSSRYATDITPLAVRAKYLILECGTNDISQGHTLAQIQADITAIYTASKADGYQFVMFTAEPSNSIAGSPAKEAIRQQLNAWIKQTFPLVLDVASVEQDPYDPRFIRRDPLWYPSDGVHPLQAGRRAIGEYVANSFVGNTTGYPQIFDFQRPAPYQPALAASGPSLSGTVTLPSIKATTGNRYVCVDTAGNITSSAAPCSGT